MLRFKKRNPKIILKFEWASVDLRKYIKSNLSCSGNGIRQLYIDLKTAGRDIPQPYRNKKVWQFYPTKSNATICLKINKDYFYHSDFCEFGFWHTQYPKFLGYIRYVDNKQHIHKKHVRLKNRMEKWK